MKSVRALGSAALRAAPILFVLLAALVALSPVGVGFSGGITSESAPNAQDFARYGCTSCHGEHNVFPARDASVVSWTIEGEDGTPLNGPYEADAVYLITIRLNETVNPNRQARAGFNLQASAGKLEGVAGQSQVSGDGSQATHVDATRASWQVRWTAPHDGPAVFGVLVNDVDGDGSNSPGDIPYRVGFFVTGPDGAIPGAVLEEHLEFGISLQQYWIGLIGLAGMLLIMVAAFLYLKFASPHNADAKDR